LIACKINHKIIPIKNIQNPNITGINEYANPLHIIAPEISCAGIKAVVAIKNPLSQLIIPINGAVPLKRKTAFMPVTGLLFFDFWEIILKKLFPANNTTIIAIMSRYHIKFPPLVNKRIRLF
jgi:hypothetical protein